MTNRRPDPPDVLYHINNGFLAVAPAPGGRLRNLVELTQNGGYKVWLFSQIGKTSLPDGSVHVDVLTRGVVCGTRQQGVAFLKQCRELGLLVTDEPSLFVPCSNGMIGATEHRTTVVGWRPAELVYLRFDLPTQEVLEQHIPVLMRPRVPSVHELLTHG